MVKSSSNIIKNLSTILLGIIIGSIIICIIHFYTNKSDDIISTLSLSILVGIYFSVMILQYIYFKSFKFSEVSKRKIILLVLSISIEIILALIIWGYFYVASVQLAEG